MDSKPSATPSPHMVAFDSALETHQHRGRVRDHLNPAIFGLLRRGSLHDLSKLEPEEKPILDAVIPEIQGAPYGSPEYAAGMARLKPMLDHHYAVNSHHPEHHQPEERWLPVVGYEGMYEVSNLGQVRSVDRVVPRAGTQGDLSRKGQLRTPHVTPKGYLRVQLSKDGKPSNRMVHVLVAEAFIPNPDNKPEVNHNNGNKAHNYVGNLAWMTESENQIHAYDAGLKKPAIKYLIICPELELFAYGTEEMERKLRERGYDRAQASGIWRAINKDGAKHLDLVFIGEKLADAPALPVGVLGMSLLDLIEMLADWRAASERPGGRGFAYSLEHNVVRFKIPDALADILRRSAMEFFWADVDELTEARKLVVDVTSNGK